MNKIGFCDYKICTIHDARIGTRKTRMFIKAQSFFFFLYYPPLPILFPLALTLLKIKR